MTSERVVSFFGAISPSRSAIKRSGSIEGGATVTFDVPESQIDVLVDLISMVGKPLHVTIRALHENIADMVEQDI